MTPARSEALAALAEVLDLAEDVRIGQMFVNLGHLSEGNFGPRLWDIEDGELVALLRRHREELRDRRPASEAARPPG